MHATCIYIATFKEAVQCYELVCVAIINLVDTGYRQAKLVNASGCKHACMYVARQLTLIKLDSNNSNIFIITSTSDLQPSTATANQLLGKNQRTKLF